jgi:hypothetical protein
MFLPISTKIVCIDWGQIYDKAFGDVLRCFHHSIAPSLVLPLQEETATPTATSRRVSLKMPSGQPNPTAFS